MSSDENIQIGHLEISQSNPDSDSNSSSGSESNKNPDELSLKTTKQNEPEINQAENPNMGHEISDKSEKSNKSDKS